MESQKFKTDMFSIVQERKTEEKGFRQDRWWRNQNICLNKQLQQAQSQGDSSQNNEGSGWL